MSKHKIEWFVVPLGGGATNEVIAKELGQAGIGTDETLFFEGKDLRGYVLPDEFGHKFITQLKRVKTTEGLANFVVYEKQGRRLRFYRFDDLRNKAKRKRLMSKVKKGSEI
jgi:hypothetical protein